MVMSESVAFFVLGVALLAKPLRRRRQQLVFLHHALTARQELHFLTVADFLAGNGHGVELWDGARKIAVFKTSNPKPWSAHRRN
jgi:hypothetical protein